MDRNSKEEVQSKKICKIPDNLAAIKRFDEADMKENVELQFGVGVNVKVYDKKNFGYRKYRCPHSVSGCEAMFVREDSWTSHANGCLFGLTRWCKDLRCIAAKNGRAGSLPALVQHANTDHDCVTLDGVDGDMEIPITLNEEFGKPEERRFSSKILGMCKWNTDAYKFHLAFFGMMWEGAVENNKKVLQLLPILYGEPGLPNRSNFFVRVKMRLSLVVEGNKRVIPCYGTLVHPSHKTEDALNVYVGAYRSNTQTLESIEKNQTVQYLLEIGDSPIHLVLHFTVDKYRCFISGEDKWPSYAQFGLTWKELGVDENTRALLGSEEEPSPFTGIFLPQFKTGMNMMIGTSEPLRIIKHVLAIRKHCVTGTVKPLMVVLFPASFMLSSSGSAIVDVVTSIGLSAVLLTKNDVNTTEFFQIGCNVLITTPLVLLDITGNDLHDKWGILLSNLEFVVVPDADYVRLEGMEYKLKSCLNFFVKKAGKRIVRIAISPHLNHYATLTLSPSIVEREYRAMVLGPHPFDQVKSIGATEINSSSYFEKSEAVIRIIRENAGCRRLLIVGNERNSSYKKDFDALVKVLQNEFPHWDIMRRERQTHIDASAFNEFKTEKREKTVLLTSYYFLHYEAAKESDCFVIFENPKRMAIMLRLLPLVQTNDGTNKKVYLIN